MASSPEDRNQERLEAKLVSYVQDAHAMESDVLVMLQSLIATTPDGEIQDRLREHADETREQLSRLEACLASHNRGSSTRKDLQGVAAALGKGVVDALRSDRPARNARDAFVTEHLEIAAYELLERLAIAAGDLQTAEVARTNLAEERLMAEFIDERWERFIQLTLEGAGIKVPQLA